LKSYETTPITARLHHLRDQLIPINMGTSHKDPERAFALQKYLLLHSQHDALQKHLDQIITSSPSVSPTYQQFAVSSSSSSDDGLYFEPPSHPSTRQHRSGSIPQCRPMVRTRSSSLPATIDSHLLDEIQEHEAKIKNVNMQIKTTLTELLNCGSVRGDGRYRMWVQTRLMDVERELKMDKSKSCDRRRNEDVGMSY
jgi:hypothetical protein